MVFNSGNQETKEKVISFKGKDYKSLTFETLNDKNYLGREIESEIIGASFGKFERASSKRYGWICVFAKVDDGFISRLQAIFTDENGNPSLSSEKNDIGHLIAETIGENDIENINNFVTGVKIKMVMSIQTDYKTHLPKRNNFNEQYLTFNITEIVSKNPIVNQTNLKNDMPFKKSLDDNFVLCSECSKKMGEKVLIPKVVFAEHYTRMHG